MSAPTKVIATSPAGPHSPSHRVRVVLPKEELSAHGVLIQDVALLTEAQERGWRTGSASVRARIVLESSRRLRETLDASDAPTALVSRQGDLTPLLAVERAAGREGRRLIYDVDDAIWYSGRRAAGGHPLALMKATGRKARWLAQRADTVIAGTDFLAEWLQDHSSHVVVVPSLVVPSEQPRSHQDAKELVIGWIGSHSTAGYLARAVPAIETVARKLRPQHTVRLLVVGGPAIAVRGVVTESVPWKTANERWALKRMDIGIMPLPDNLWTRGKGAYKALEYMAAGVPALVDDVGVARGYVEAHGAGVVATGDRAWADALAELLVAPAVRAEMGAAGHRAAAAHFSPQRWAPELAKILTGAA